MSDELPPPPADDGWLGWMIRTLAPDPEKVRAWVEELRAENRELGREALADYIGDYIVWTYAKQGASLALPGAIPGLGTVVQVATDLTTVGVDLSLMVRNQTYLVFALGECLGIRGRETLIQDALICIGLWSKALVLTKSGAIRMGAKVAEANFRKRVPGELFQAINRRVGTTVLTKYGTKRGGVAIGTFDPVRGRSGRRRGVQLSDDEKLQGQHHEVPHAEGALRPARFCQRAFKSISRPSSSRK